MNAEATPPASYPRQGGAPVYGLPLKSEGPADFFPPVCLKSHWDPTAILSRTLPEQYVAQPLDFRPWTKVCMQYTTAGDTESAEAVHVGGAAVLPSGGQFYPPSRYMAAIDQESQLRRLDRPLGTCEGNQWEPHVNSDMYDPSALVPRTATWGNSDRVQELAYPRALLRSGPYDCREQLDQMNVGMSSDYLFNNATKQDKYKLMKKPVKPAAPDAPLQGVSPSSLRPELALNVQKPEWQQTGYVNPTKSNEAAAAGARADLVANAKTPEQQAREKAQQQQRQAAVGTMPFIQ